MKKIIIFGIEVLVMLAIVATAQIVSVNNEIKAESKEIYDLLKSEGLTDFKRTPCIVYSETYCRVEDMHSASGEIVRIDIRYSGKTVAEIDAEALAEIEIQLNDYAKNKLQPESHTIYESIGSQETITIKER